MIGDKARQQLADVAWARYLTMTNNEGRDEHDAFIEVVKRLLEIQDEAWSERLH